MPEAVPAGTVTVPLVLVRKPDGTFSQVSVTELVLGLPLPFKLSFVNTLGVVPPVSPLVIVWVSSFATIGALPTLIVSVAVSQLLGFNFSQIR